MRDQLPSFLEMVLFYNLKQMINDPDYKVNQTKPFKDMTLVSHNQFIFIQTIYIDLPQS